MKYFKKYKKFIHLIHILFLINNIEFHIILDIIKI